MTPHNNGEPYTWEGELGMFGLYPMLAGPNNDWGAFDLAGILQLDWSGAIYRACGLVCLADCDLRLFLFAGSVVHAHREKDTYWKRNPTTPHVFCIPGERGKIR
ncbi:unnamed protein product [Ectocarpus sp. 12 AP-2014]